MTLYLDSSSIVKLYVQEPNAESVRRLLSEATAVFTSTVAYAEVRGALARQRRDRTLTAERFAKAKQDFEKDWSLFVTVDVTDALSRTAGTLAEQHGLRGFDAIHLATLEQLLGRVEDEEFEFSTADERLAKAAKKLG